MRETPRALARAANIRLVALKRRVIAWRPRARLASRAVPEPAAAPPAPFIARSPEWPPPPPQPLDLDEFGRLSPDGRAAVAAIVEPDLARLRAAVLDVLTQRPELGRGDSGIARAIAGCVGELAGLIEAVDRYNAMPDSCYRILPRLKSFLVECAVTAIGDLADDELPEFAAIAA